MNELVQIFVGEEISYEGDFSVCSFESFSEVCTVQRYPFIRDDLTKKDFIISHLTQETIEPLRKIFLRNGLRHSIAHVLIGNKEGLLFWSYDFFDKNCVGIHGEFPVEFLQKLIELKIISSFEKKESNNDFFEVNMGNHICSKSEFVLPPFLS